MSNPNRKVATIRLSADDTLKSKTSGDTDTWMYSFEKLIVGRDSVNSNDYSEVEINGSSSIQLYSGTNLSMPIDKLKVVNGEAIVIATKSRKTFST